LGKWVTNNPSNKPKIYKQNRNRTGISLHWSTRRVKADNTTKTPKKQTDLIKTMTKSQDPTDPLRNQRFSTNKRDLSASKRDKKNGDSEGKKRET